MTNILESFVENWIKGTWIQTWTGKKFDYFKIESDSIDIIDIAESLSKQCRYVGHCSSFYSVAEHCCLISDNVSKKNKMWGLMHDAVEAYIGDIPTPLKRILPNVRNLEQTILLKIAIKYDMITDTSYIPQEVKLADKRILTDEYHQLISKVSHEDMSWNLLEELGVKIKCWQPAAAKHEFMIRFAKLYGEQK